MSNPKDYTVGWICATTTEYVAAQAFLDENHDGPEYVSPSDNNDYTLGKFGKHNVVIAVLPDGEYGTSSAASVARDMLHSFTNIRIGLMVGIGGGAPSQRHDIRLGDITVSAPRDGEGGVLQYDFGKTIQNGAFQLTKFLNQPPTILRTAVSGLKAQYEIEGNQIEAAINSILEKKPRLRKKYQRPELGSDRLYRSRIVHPPKNEANCTITCGNDPSKLILRSERAKDEDSLVVHYGLIASANQLMKNALVRDTLAAEKDILCFEMEAAGLINHFPCLVIRGICDYSDSHKNKEWQGYAAMAAAAYAKDLLYRISPNRLETEKRIVDVLSGIQESVMDISRGIDKLLHGQHDKEREAILKWITPIDYAPQQVDYIKRRQEGTGQWLLDSAEFMTWLDSSKQTLFCPGIPGAGKTILTSIVIDDLTARYKNDPTIGIAYIYCNFRRKDDQKVENLLASLLRQLAQEQPSLPDVVKDLYRQHKEKRTRLSLKEISTALQCVATMYLRVFIIVDALDECQVYDGCRTKFLSELFDLQAKSGVNLFATSRLIPEIKERFEGSILLEIRASNEDVQRYLDGHMHRLPGFVRRSQELQEEVKTEIVKAVGGMFLLAQLHLDSLAGIKSRKALRAALNTLPEGTDGYDPAYKDAMERIEGQARNSRDIAKQALSWITCAKRLLTTSELQHALSVELATSELDEDNIPEIEDIVSVCAGLIIIDKESDIIRLVHYTTEEYFERTWSTWFPDAQTDIAKACVTYLSFDTFEAGFSPTDKDFEVRLQSNILYNYAAQNWGHHARVSSIEGETLILGLLESKTKVSACSQAMMVSESYPDYSQEVPKNITGVHLAAYFGLRRSVTALLNRQDDADLESKGDDGRTPLSWAAENGHEAVVKLLLDKDANLESIDGSGRTPLLWAAENGHEEVVKLLLDKDANLESVDDDGRTPLLWAAYHGYEAVVKLLLDKGANLEPKDDMYGLTPLSWAARKGHEAVVKLLLDKDADVESMDNRHSRTPLSWATENGHEAVVNLLLKHAAATAVVDTDRPLSVAAVSVIESREAATAALQPENTPTDDPSRLMALSQTPERKSAPGLTPLTGAIYGRQVKMVEQLLKAGADVNERDGYKFTPLTRAAWEGSFEIAKLLLKWKAKVSAYDGYGFTALSRAATSGHVEIVDLLLKNGAGVNTPDRDVKVRPVRYTRDSDQTKQPAESALGLTPLTSAIHGEQVWAVERLLKAGADINACDGYKFTPLTRAAWNGSFEIVELLLNWRAEVSIRDGYGFTALSRAASSGHVEIVDLLRRYGAEI